MSSPQESNLPGEVTVVMPCFNASKYVRSAIESVLGQSVAVSRIVVVDDGSTDDSLEVLTEFKDVVVVLSQENQGVAAARNAGAKASNTQYLYFFDCDDVLLPEAIETLLTIAKAEDAKVVYGDVYAIDPEGRRLSSKPMGYRDPEGRTLRSLCAGALFAQGAALIDRDLFFEAGGYPPGMSHAEDFDLQFRLASKAEFLMTQTPVLEYRMHPQSATRNYSMMVEGALGAYSRNRSLRLWSRFPLQCLMGHLKVAFYFCSEHQSAARKGHRSMVIEGQRAIARHPWMFTILIALPVLRVAKALVRKARLFRRSAQTTAR